MLNEFVAITTGLAAVLLIIEKITVWLNLARRLSRRNTRPGQHKDDRNDERRALCHKCQNPSAHRITSTRHDDDREP
jgi:hypothetical protein